MEENNILQFLKHSDKNNRLLGVHLAKSANWSNRRIFANLKFNNVKLSCGKERCHIYRVGNIIFKQRKHLFYITGLNTDNKVKTRIKFSFRIYKDYQTIANKIGVNRRKKKRVKEKYINTFIETILKS